MNAKTKAVEEKKGLCHHAGTPTPSKRQQNENFLKMNKYFATEAAWRWVGDPMLVLKLSCDLDVTLSKRFVFWAGPVNYSFQKMVQMHEG